MKYHFFNRWEVYEFIKQQRWRDNEINTRMIMDAFPGIEPEEVSEGIEEYKAAKWLKKGA
ncbi:hypothetical protein [Paenibacillus sabinae]|uniref:hypothetical protein n=1 Tax=Paenibacillus sabinae TaxID=365617 RepID=UPI00046D4DA0|nr:hypothetical protein [Paenibacillus sabinae]